MDGRCANFCNAMGIAVMGKDNVDLICSVAELVGLFAGSHGLDEFFQRIVDTVAEHMHASVCSIYLYDEAREDLVLRATRGLSPQAVGTVRLKLGEGIVGLAVKELRPVRESHASRSPFYKFIPGIEEERYQAFLAVPVLRGLSRVGGLVVQHVEPGYFDENDTKALRAIAAQLANVIENAKLLASLHDLQPPADTAALELGEVTSARRPFIKGTPGAGGHARGGAIYYGQLVDDSVAPEFDEPTDNATMLADFDRALELAEHQLESLEERMKNQLADLSVSLIFSAQLLMLKDDSFSGRMRAVIEDGVTPARAIRDVVEQFAVLFSQNSNPRLQEKVQDVRDLGHRLLLNLGAKEGESGDYAGRVVIGGDLLPSDLLKIAAQRAAGLILTRGSLTAHLSILARSLDIPLVLSHDRLLSRLAEGTPILIDADQGMIYVEPDAAVIQQYDELEAAAASASSAVRADDGITLTSDGTRVHVLTNINLLSELQVAKHLQAEGIGLYRSEFPFIIRNDFPSEEEQYRIYRKVVDEMQGREVVFRTLDIGGDKMVSYFPTLDEANPFLGLRAIRFSLRYKNLFSQQLRAMLRAGAAGPLRVMFPLVSSVDDFVAAKTVVLECIEDLASEGVPHNASPLLGVMIELPSAVEMADDLALEADFLCLGTNDLIQYMLAADRTNEHISEYYVPYHPAVLRAVRNVAAAAAKHHKPLSVCGEMASDARLVPFLLGIGIRTLSVDVRKLVALRNQVRGITIADAEKQTRRLLELATISGIRDVLTQAQAPAQS